MRIIAKLMSKIWGRSESSSFVTPQSRALCDALIQRGINAVPEHSDGYKHVDIAIPEARIYIEVDGLDHFTKPDRIIADFNRAYYSNVDGFNTFHVTNQIIEKYLNEVTNAIVDVVKVRLVK
jgi:very-short-patch-repair endonuclease